MGVNRVNVVDKRIMVYGWRQYSETIVYVPEIDQDSM